MDITEMLVSFGGEIKAAQLDDGSVKLGGYLVLFGDPDNTDLAQDYFAPDTDFGDAEASVAYVNHRLPIYGKSKAVQRKNPLKNKARLTRDETGVFAEIILEARDEYERALAELGLAGKLGWSSGTAAHLVDREPVKDGVHKITYWPLGLDASLTPTPAEYRNLVIPLKSLIKDPEGAEPGDDETKSETNPIHSNGDTIMDENEVKTVTMTEDEVQAYIDAAADRAVEAFKAAAPVEPEKSTITVTRDEADVPFKSLAENCYAVKQFELSKGRNEAPRLKALKAIGGTGASEGSLVDGGFLLEPTLTKELIKPMHEEGPYTRLARRLPVGADSNYGWINGVDETSRAAGSRWGGIRGYRLAEGASLTASRPTFRRINWELKKYAVLVYATDELLKDSSQFSEVVRTGAAEELMFMANDDILNGLGVGGPKGILDSACLVSVTIETGQTVSNPILTENISKMWQRLLPRSRATSAWFINNELEPFLDHLSIAVGTGGLEPRFVTYGMDGIMRIKGRPVYVTEFNAAVGTAGDILLADMGEYLFWEKGGIDAAASIHVQFTTDEQVFRFIYRCDGQPTLASAITPYKGSNTQSPFVALAARS